MNSKRKILTWVKIGAIRKGVSHKDISEAIGISRNSFTQIINGYKNMPKGFEEKLREYFKK